MTAAQYEELLALFRRALTAIATGQIGAREMRVVAKKVLETANLRILAASLSEAAEERNKTAVPQEHPE